MNTFKKSLLSLMSLLVVTFATGLTVSAQQPINSCQTITTSGPYILTANLSSAGDCLIVSADNVTIDLGGYVIFGINRVGVGRGIRAPEGSTALPRNITIRNGAIRNFEYGVRFSVTSLDSRNVVIERMTITNNSERGVFIGEQSIVRDCIVSDNNYGIRVGANSLVAGNVVSNNDGNGITADGGSIVIGNVAGGNGINGIVVTVSPPVSIINNNASGNGKYGIVANCPSNLLGNTAVGNSVENVFFLGAGCATTHNLAP